MTDVKTGTSNVRWSLFVYPWSPTYPTGGSVTNSFIGLAGTAVTGGGTGSPGDPLPPVRVVKGINYMSFQRNKSFHDNVLRISFIGPVHPSIVIGNWVVLKSNARLKPNGDLKLDTEESVNQAARVPIPRFIGQIYSVEPNYEADPNTGQMRHVTTVTVKEWSHVLDMAIRFDESVIIEALSSDPSFGVALAQKQNDLTTTQMAELSTKLFNPLEFVHLLLTLIGGITADQSLMDTSIQGIRLPALALRLPIIPKTLLDDLGIGGFNPLSSIVSGSLKKPSVGDSGADAFAAGFSTTITGVLKNPLHNDGNWDGIFDSGEIDAMASGDLYNKEPVGRPAAAGLTPIIASGMSAWQMIQNTCDSDFNEVYTDILYERSGSPNDKKIIAKPVLWVRDKPFATKTLYFKNSKLAFSGEWTKYDDLPRLYIPQAYIERVGFSLTKANAYNYIKVEFLPGVIKDEETRVLSTIKGTIRGRQNEMLRFGGQEMFAKTNYISQEFIKGDSGALGALSDAASALGVGTGNPQWFEQLRDILDIWWGEYYKMPPATMVIKDYSVPISIGLNVTWILGGIQLVGHVIGTNTTITIDETGKHATETVIILDRVMKTVKDPEILGQSFGAEVLASAAFLAIGSAGVAMGTDLEFITPDKLTNLIHEIHPPDNLGASISKSLKGISIVDPQRDPSDDLDKNNSDPVIA